MTSQSPSTPPPSVVVNPPQTPKHGYQDAWEPFAPRASARIAASRLRKAAKSPQPGSPRSLDPGYESTRRLPKPSQNETATTSPGASSMVLRRQNQELASSKSASTPCLLPTPSKTPRKQPQEKCDASLRAVARSLFHGDDDGSTPTRRKTQVKHTLDTLPGDVASESFDIYTDLRDRMPQVDDAVDNPFYPKDDAPATRSSVKPKRTQDFVYISGEGMVSVEDAIRRDDGMLVVFRGKKQFRKFASTPNTGPSEDSGTGGSLESLRRMTRSAFKPRQLFPVSSRLAKARSEAKIDEHTDEQNDEQSDEEAETDIEDCPRTQEDSPAVHDSETVEASTQPPKETEEKMPQTPTASKFQPLSPPTSRRTTRFQTKLVRESGSSRLSSEGKSANPFSGWRRTKSSASDSSRKRSAEPLGPETPKRSRA